MVKYFKFFSIQTLRLAFLSSIQYPVSRKMVSLPSLLKLLPCRIRGRVKRTILDSDLFAYLNTRWIAHLIDNLERGNYKPRVAYLEATNKCNANCLMCPREKMTRPTGVMDMGLFKNVVNQLVDLNIEEIRLHNFGEPLLDENIAKKINYIKSRDQNIKLNFYTNAYSLSEELAREFVNSKLDRIFISIDEIDPDAYFKIRKLDLETVEKNVMRLMDIRNEMKVDKPEIYVCLTRVDQPDSSVNAFIDKWQTRADMVTVGGAHDWASQKDGVSINGINRLKKWPCVYLWNDLYVLWDGRATICCEDFDGLNIVGDLNNETVLDVWNSGKFKAIRKLMKENKRNGIKVCSGCSLRPLWSCYDE